MPRGKLIDLVGQRFGKLVVVGRAAREKGCRPYWTCLCDCGNLNESQGRNLISGEAKSCGCWKVERLTTHGHTAGGKSTPIFRAWSSMFERCYNPKHEHYKSYGGRGIAVCPRWHESFENFLADMGPSWSPELTLDRYPDNDGDYEPGNCRWATQAQQSRNRRTTVLLTFDGKEQTLTEWAAELGLTRPALRYRLNAGWPLERVLTK